MEKLGGVVEQITYSDEEKRVSVLKIKRKGYAKLLTIVGNMSCVNVGSVVTAEGNWTINPKFVWKLNLQKWEESIISNVYGIEKHLSSELICVIGTKYPQLIVKTFGENIIDIIKNNPSELIEVPNIGIKRIIMIIWTWQEHKSIKNIIIFMTEYGIYTIFSYRIYKVHSDNSIEEIKEKFLLSCRQCLRNWF